MGLQYSCLAVLVRKNRSQAKQIRRNDGFDVSTFTYHRRLPHAALGQKSPGWFLFCIEILEHSGKPNVRLFPVASVCHA